MGQVRPETADEPGDHGGARVVVEVDDPGMIGHWKPGMEWATTAYDELGDCKHFHFGKDSSPREWTRDGA